MALSEISQFEKPATLDIWGFQVTVDAKGLVAETLVPISMNKTLNDGKKAIVR